jgi:hypothetical protein
VPGVSALLTGFSRCFAPRSGTMRRFSDAVKTVQSFSRPNPDHEIRSPWRARWSTHLLNISRIEPLDTQRYGAKYPLRASTFSLPDFSTLILN